MGRSIVRLSDAEHVWYLEWSSVSDAPATYGMPLEEMRAYCRDRYGSEGNRDFDERIERAVKTGSSSFDNDSLASAVGFNRAGEGETCLTVEQLIDVFCRRKPPIRGHKHHVDKDGCSSAKDCLVYIDATRREEG